MPCSQQVNETGQHIQWVGKFIYLYFVDLFCLQVEFLCMKFCDFRNDKYLRL